MVSHEKARSRVPTEARTMVEEQRLGFVATVKKDGSPNLSPKGTVSVWDDHHLIFADLDSPGTIANLERDPRIEVNVVDAVSRRGWRFRGRARVVHEGPDFEAGVRFFSRRDVEDAPRRIRSIVYVEVDRASPLISPAYSAGNSEADIRQRSWKRLKTLYEPDP